MNGFLLADATNTSAKQFPDVKWAITDYSQSFLPDKPANAYGLTFKSEESGYLVGFLAAQMAKAKIGRGQVVRQARSERGRRQEDPVGRQLDRRLSRWRAGRRQAVQGPDRLLGRLPALHRSEVQGDRAQAHLPGRSGGLPGRRRLWPRRAAGRKAEGCLGHRRRRRPGLPRQAHHDERREAGRHGRLHVLQARAGRQARRRPRPALQPEEQGPGRRQDQPARPLARSSPR